MSDRVLSSSGSSSAGATRTPLVFGGIPEAEGWVLAPITPRDRVHFRVDRELPLAEFRGDLPDGVTVSYDQGEGLYRVDGACGQGERHVFQHEAFGTGVGEGNVIETDPLPQF